MQNTQYQQRDEGIRAGVTTELGTLAFQRKTLLPPVSCFNEQCALVMCVCVINRAD